MVSAYNGLVSKLNRISKNYDTEKKYQCKDQIIDLVTVAKYLHDIAVLTDEQFNDIENAGYKVFSRYDIRLD